MFQVATVTRPGGGRIGVQLGGRSGTNAGTFLPLKPTTPRTTKSTSMGHMGTRSMQQNAVDWYWPV